MGLTSPLTNRLTSATFSLSSAYNVGLDLFSLIFCSSSTILDLNGFLCTNHHTNVIGCMGIRLFSFLSK